MSEFGVYEDEHTGSMYPGAPIQAIMWGLVVPGTVSSENWTCERTERLWLIKEQEDSRWRKIKLTGKNEHGGVARVLGTGMRPTLNRRPQARNFEVRKWEKTNRLYLSDTTGYWHDSAHCPSLREKCLQTYVSLCVGRSSMRSAQWLHLWGTYLLPSKICVGPRKPG